MDTLQLVFFKIVTLAHCTMVSEFGLITYSISQMLYSLFVLEYCYVIESVLLY